MLRTTFLTAIASILVLASTAQQARADGARAGSDGSAVVGAAAGSAVSAGLSTGASSSLQSVGAPRYSDGSSYVVKGKHSPEPESFAEPLAFTYILAPLMLAAGIHYSEPLGFDDLGTGSQVAFGTLPFLLPPLVHLGYDDPGGALVAIGGMLYFTALGAVTGGITGYMWEEQVDPMPAVWDSRPARRGALIGAGVGYAIWALIDVIALSDVPDRSLSKQKKKKNGKRAESRKAAKAGAVGATISPVMGGANEAGAPVGVHGAAFTVQGAW